ncbi:hypothetical protein Ple7327_1466 [Pleurocapsa sp. PCC 7327]|uniref:prenyltransferase/squalene oxidase repeat-containing protein n=1 Tax=Pleurocapsa sp. PCC 7327 TaxID=118163 RepID=UPI00029FDC39|nr:prenyltransferase/squalene oxidase repeat-containing protein [Pleurocapsa sp. PCC 7327]AFY76845.1 hypothetical protein Ple7327_1466 [Pleurocapsa sp. PCC 7327]
MSNLRTNNIAERTIQYLSDKQCANGGFCAYKMEYLEEPNPRDTFFAVASFQLLGEAIPNRDRVEAYLHQILTELKTCLLPPTGTLSKIHSASAFNYLYFPFYTLYRMGSLHLDEFWQEVLSRLEILLPEQMYPNESGASQQWLLRKVRTKKLCGAIPNHQQIIDFVLNLKNEGGFGIKPNLIDTYWSISLLEELDYDLSHMDDTRQFIQRLQVPQTGFTLTEEGIATSLEVIYAGIFASLMLQMEIPYFDAALQFVRMCQMERGGFARMPVGLPDLECTYRALKVLKTRTDSDLI